MEEKTAFIKVTKNEGKSGVSCLLCGKFVEAHNPTICPDCKALWEMMVWKLTTKKGAEVVALTKEQSLLGFIGRVLDTRVGEALVEFPMVNGKRVVTWLKEKDFTEIK